MKLRNKKQESKDDLTRPWAKGLVKLKPESFLVAGAGRVNLKGNGRNQNELNILKRKGTSSTQRRSRWLSSFFDQHQPKTASAIRRRFDTAVTIVETVSEIIVGNRCYAAVTVSEEPLRYVQQRVSQKKGENKQPFDT